MIEMPLSGKEKPIRIYIKFTWYWSILTRCKKGKLELTPKDW